MDTLICCTQREIFLSDLRTLQPQLSDNKIVRHFVHQLNLPISFEYRESDRHSTQLGSLSSWCHLQVHSDQFSFHRKAEQRYDDFEEYVRPSKASRRSRSQKIVSEKATLSATQCAH